jgi:hypothetical protein
VNENNEVVIKVVVGNNEVVSESASETVSLKMNENNEVVILVVIAFVTTSEEVAIIVRYFSADAKIKEYCSSTEMVAHFFTKPVKGRQCMKLQNEILVSVNPRCLDYSLEDCRSVLNIAATGGGQTTSTGTDTGWISGELKKDEQTERIVSRLDSAKTQDCSKGVFTGTEKRTETAEIWKE